MTQEAIARAKDFTRAKTHHFIGCTWREPETDARIDIINPATEDVLTSISVGGVAEVDQAVSAARAAFEGPTWRNMPAAERERLLLALADRIEANLDEIAAIETIDMGMPYMAAKFGAIKAAVSAVRYNAGWARRMGGDVAPVSAPGEWHGYIDREPMGVAALIVPWNAPFVMTCGKLSAALAAGCTVVIKPAELAPLSTLRLAQLVEETGFPAGVVNVVTGDGATTGNLLARHKGVDKVSFTGSTTTGKMILQDSIADLKRVSLELGGKSPVFIFSDANLSKAIPGAAMGIFANSGQVCAAGSRLYIHDTVYDQVVEGVAEFAKNMKLGDGMDEGVNLGPLISEKQRARVMSFIEAGKEQGARLITGGEQPNRKGFFVEPTVFVDVKPDMAIFREEIFGPVLSVMRFKEESFDDLAALANDTIYGLSSYLWTENLNTAHAMIKRIKAGSVKVNGAGMEFTLPFGGYKQSGIGRENGRFGVEAFTEVKAVMLGYTSGA